MDPNNIQELIKTNRLDKLIKDYKHTTCIFIDMTDSDYLKENDSNTTILKEPKETDPNKKRYKSQENNVFKLHLLKNATKITCYHNLSCQIFQYPNYFAWPFFSFKVLKSVYLLLHGTYENGTNDIPIMFHRY